MPNGRHGQQRPPAGGGARQPPGGAPRGGGDVICFEIPRCAAPGFATAILGDHHTLQSREAWKDVPTGHRFQLYFHGMSDSGTVDAPQGRENRDERDRRRRAADEGDWQTLQAKGARIEREWIPLKNQKRVALQTAAGMGRVASDLLSALGTRADALRGPEHWQRTAELIAPLATGLGNPHPVENGFAFLSPYGVPYLAGSGVKGVLRRAAEELAFFGAESPWSITHVWALFGFDENSTCLWKRPEEMTEKEREKLSPVVAEQIIRWRGAYERWVAAAAATDPVLAAWKQAIEKQLPTSPRNWREASPKDFAMNLLGEGGTALRRAIHWQGLLAVQDAFPDPRTTMAVDILNPHHREYFEGNGAKTPHDAENPVPVFFLTVAPGARFTFSARPLGGREALWRAIGDRKLLLDAAFDHARDWLGFGAKTAVGYGAMRAVSSKAEVPSERNAAGQLVQKRGTIPEAPREEVWPSAKLVWKPGPGELSASFEGRSTAPLKGELAQKLIAALGDRANRLKKDKELKNVAVRVREGKPIELLGLAEAKT